MPRALWISALGAFIRIDGSALSREAWAAAQVAWQGAAVEPPVGVPPAATVIAHGTITVQAMLSALSMEVTYAALEARAGQLVMLHAAGLVTAQGGVIVLVGPSGRGKTTASRVLGNRFGYVSDESIGIAADGTVLPYRKPLSLIENGRLPKLQRSPAELGLLPLPTAPLQLAALVMLERTDDTNSPRSERLSLAEGIAGLAQQASYLGRLPAPLRTIGSHIESVGGVHRITYSDAETLAPLVRELGARSPVPFRVQVGLQISAPTSSAPRQDGAHTYRRIPVLDSLVLDDEQVVLLVRDDEVSTRVVVLDGIAPTLWRNTSEPATLAALLEATVRAHGEPVGADAAGLVAASVTELTEAGLLICD